MTNPKRSPIRWGRIGILVGAVALAGILVWAFLPEPVLVEESTAISGNVVVEAVEDGKTRVLDRYVVSAPVTGNLARSALRVGDAVLPGTVVARLLPMDAPLLDARTRAEIRARLSGALDGRRVSEARAHAAELAAADAEHELIRLRQLAVGGGVSPRDLESAEALARVRGEEATSARFAVEVAAHEAEVAQALLRRAPSDGSGMDLSSPVNGVVLRLFQESGGPVQAGTPVLEIGDPAQLEVVVDVLTADAVRIAPGAPARLERWGGPDALIAHVVRVDPAAITRVSALGVEEQRVDVVLSLDSPHASRARLGDGFRVDVRMEVARQDGVLVIPEAAVFRRDGGFATWVDEDGRATLRMVDVGLRDGVRVEIRSGLAAGDVVVVHPSDTLVEGARVKVP